MVNHGLPLKSPGIHFCLELCFGSLPLFKNSICNIDPYHYCCLEAFLSSMVFDHHYHCHWIKVYSCLLLLTINAFHDYSIQHSFSVLFCFLYSWSLKKRVFQTSVIVQSIYFMEMERDFGLTRAFVWWYLLMASVA